MKFKPALLEELKAIMNEPSSFPGPTPVEETVEVTVRQGSEIITKETMKVRKMILDHRVSITFNGPILINSGQTLEIVGPFLTVK